MPARPPRLSITMLGFGADHLHTMTNVAREAERAGVDAIQMPEHVIMHGKARDTFPAEYGAFFHELDEPMPDPFVTLGAISAVTERVQLVTGILIAPLRPAALLAKQAATLHAMSRGRFVLGVSASWQRGEYEALGVPYAERGRRLDDTLRACRALWAEAPAGFNSSTVTFSDVYCSPRPGTGHGIPIWFGGAFGPRLVRRIVEGGHGWILFSGLGETADTIRSRVAQVKEALAEAGRDPDALEVSSGSLTPSPDLERTLETVPALFDAGVTMLQVGIQRYVRTPDEATEFVHRLAQAFAPLRGAEPTVRSP